MAGINGQLRDQQRHVGQLHLVANQVIGQARRIINDRIGDQMLVISRIYQLQSAVQAHEWHGNARDEMLDYLEHLLRDVAHVEDCKEEENEDSDIANKEAKYMESVTVIRTGRSGGQWYDIPRDLLENLIQEGHGARREELKQEVMFGVNMDIRYHKDALWNLFAGWTPLKCQPNWILM
eukprot:288493_1